MGVLGAKTCARFSWRARGDFSARGLRRLRPELCTWEEQPAVGLQIGIRNGHVVQTRKMPVYQYGNMKQK